MAKIVLSGVVVLSALIVQLQGCSRSESSQQTSVFQSVPEIVEIKPQKPVKIKMKRNASGDYSWELTGDDADRVIDANKKLEQFLHGQP